MSSDFTASISRKLPFSHLWIFRMLIPDEAKTVLDLGCGEGTFMKGLSFGKDWEIVGVDIHKKSVSKARDSGVYKSLFVGDIEKLERQIAANKNFDIVLGSQVLEHLTKEKGKRVIVLAEHLSKKRVIFSTPRGYVNQEKCYEDENPYQEHKSGWKIGDFKKMGYKVYGIGFNPVWSPLGLARQESKLTRKLSGLLSYIISPLVFYIPRLASGLIAVKGINDK